MSEHERGAPAKTDSQISRGEFEELMHQGRTGDQDAIGLLLSKYRNYLLLVANQDLDAALKAKFGASDAVQESMILAQQNFAQFRGSNESELKGWLRKILVNDIRNTRRQFATKKRDAGLEINLHEQSAVQRGIVDPHLTPGSQAIRDERAEALAAALQELPADYRTVIQMRNFGQMDFESIGERMNRSPDAARKLWARAIESLQSRLTANSPELMSGQLKVDEFKG